MIEYIEPDYEVELLTIQAMPAADIRISGARSRMDMLPDYFEAAATSKICLSGTRGSA